LIGGKRGAAFEVYERDREREREREETERLLK